MDFPESTVWKNKLFRDDNSTHLDNSSNEHPDVTCITKKINIIKKQRQYVENFNHMKPLSNVYEEPFAQQDGGGEEEEPFTEHDDDGEEEPFTEHDDDAGEEPFDEDNDDEKLFTSERIESLKMKPLKMKKIKQLSKKKNRENKKKSEKFIKDKLKKKADFEKKIFNRVFWIPNWFNKQIAKKCYSFTKTFSEMDGRHPSKENIQADSIVLQTIVYYSISYFISMWVAYNWFFLLAYIDEKAPGFKEEEKENFRPASNKNRMKIPPELVESNNNLKIMYDFILEFVTVPIWVFDMILLGDFPFPKLFSIIPYRIISKFLLLIFSFVMVYSVSLSGSIGDILFGKITIITLILNISCSLVILYKFITSFYANFEIDKDKAISKASTQDVSVLTRTLSGVFILFLYYVIRFVIALFSINISIILIILFFWFHSMFGMCFYSGDTKFYRVDMLVKKLDDYINEDLSQFTNNDEECINPSVLEKIINFFVKFLYKNLYWFTYFLVLVASILLSITGFTSSRLQQIVSFLIFSLILAVSLIMYMNIS